MLVVQLHHPGWRRPPSRMEQQVPSFLQYVSCLLDVRAKPDVTSTTKNTLRHAARAQRHPWYRRDIMTFHLAVLLPYSNSAKFSYRDGWHGCEYRSSSLSSVSRSGCQTHAANKFKTDEVIARFPRCVRSLERANRKATPLFFSILPRHTTFNTVC